MQRLSSHRSKPYAIGAFGISFALLAFGCTPSNNGKSAASGGSNSGGATAAGGNPGQGGSSASGGKTGSGGSPASGGNSTQGGTNASGGSNQGGAAGSGGSAAGGSNQGGSQNGGSAAGGSNQGGAANKGGSAAGGSNQGGSQNGGSAAGGSNQGGSQNGGSAAGGSAAGGTGAGGSNAGGTSATGGSTSTSTATAFSCTDPVYGAVSIPAAAVISDFENGSLYQYAQDGRGVGALPWYAYASGDVNDPVTNIMTTPGPVNPQNAANTFAIDTTQHGPCSTKGALHVTSPGDPKGTGGYCGFGIDFMARTTAAAKKKLAYDASKYTGVGFWAKCSSDLQFAFTKTVDATQDADVDPSIVSSPCSYSANTCNQYGIKNATVTKDWSYYKLYFSEVLQDPNGTTFTSSVDKSKLMAFQIHVNPLSPRSGTPGANKFDCYIDDVHFLSEGTPTTPSTNVTWTTSGNQILRNGSPYKIRGLVRPSMEWDCAGFGITREDIKRMKSWHANAIRLPVMDKLWSGAATGAATCNGAAYQREVKRVVNWILQEGMDVIFDLHYVSGGTAFDPSGVPTAAHTTFWTSIAGDTSFNFKDGRIIYELYNEPTQDSAGLKTWMQNTVTAIRATGAKNLILVSGTNWTYDISYYVANPVTGGAIAYVTHPYAFKDSDTLAAAAYINPAKTIPVIATEFGTANIASNHVDPGTCDASIYSNYITKFEAAGMSWTSWAWIVDEWGCGFPQIIADYSGTPNAIGTPVQTQLKALNP
jgi:hypothetical protein